MNFKYIITILSILSLNLLILKSINASIYEGFDISVKKNTPLGKAGTFSGESSSGWLSDWHTGNGKPVFSSENIELKGLKSVGGSLKVMAERKPNHIGKGFAFRQTEKGYLDTVYGSFRVKPGHLTSDSIFGLLFTLPGTQEVNLRNALFSLCPKRFGGDLGVVGVGKKTYKMPVGAPCIKGLPYLVIWKMANLPKAGESGGVSVSMWVLNEEQAEYFTTVGEFNERYLNLAETGSSKDQVSQFGRMNVKETKHSLYKGVLITPFNYNITNVVFDEIRLSSVSLKDAIGASTIK
jgi:hypothetical protein